MMRRSAVRKSTQRFVSPTLAKHNGDGLALNENGNAEGVTCGIPGAVRTTEDIFRMLEEDEDTPEDEEQKIPSPPVMLKRRLESFSGVKKKKTASLNAPNTRALKDNDLANNSADESEEPLKSYEIGALNGEGKVLHLPKEPLYFNVLFCKQSTRKHKKWEGDGILSIKGSSAILKNMEGKEIARGSGYKIKEVNGLEENSKFFIGGKECEIQSVVSEVDYVSGKCFTEVET